MTGNGGRGARLRLRLVGLAGCLWVVVIFLRLIQIQVVRHERYRAIARKQHWFELPVGAPRGAIVDRGGRPLAVDVERESVYVDPRHIPPLDRATSLLSAALDLHREGLYARLAEAQSQRRGFVYIQRRISPEQSKRLQQLRKKWIRLETEWIRSYPKATLAAHLLGGVDYEQNGIAGIERSLQSELRGRAGKLVAVHDVWGRIVEVKRAEPPQPGATIALTIDERIQYAAERALEEAVRAEGCAGGSVVVMDPNSGEVLALASYPSFDPNQTPRSMEEARLRFLNRPVSVAFEPGSVFKIVTVTAALETTTLAPETVVPCGSGRIYLFGRIVRDHHPYAALPVAEVLAKSSNIGAIQIGLRVGERRLYEYVLRFGFGRRTGVPLPAESPGKVYQLSAWQKTSIASVAMGHELSATPLQLARAVAVIANGGLLVKPKLVLWRERPDGRRQLWPTEAPERVIRPETAFTMRRLMEGVVLHGTGTAARLDGYSAAGKTGTAQIYDPVARKYLHIYNASFVGFAPVTNPAIVVAVTLNETKRFGGAVAAPVFRRVAMEALRVLNVPRDVPEAAPPMRQDPSQFNDVSLAELTTLPVEGGFEPLSESLPVPVPGTVQKPAPVLAVPDFHGKTLPAVLAQAFALGLKVEPVGSGVAREQIPPPGEALPASGLVRVVFRP